MGNRYSDFGLDKSLLQIVEKRVAKLIDAGFFVRDDADILRQEFLIHLWKAMKVYEDKKLTQTQSQRSYYKTEIGDEISQRRAFAKTVIHNKAKNLIKMLNASKRGSVSICFLHDSSGSGDNEDHLLIDTIEDNSTFTGRKDASFVDQVEFDIDIQRMVNGLPQDLRQIYELLKSKRKDEIIKIMQISERTLHRRISKLREIISKL